MSVRSETYIIYGAKLDFKKTSEIINKIDENNLPDICFPWCGKGAKGKIGVLFDGMGGEYALAGYCIEVGQEDTGIPLTNLTKTIYNPYDFDDLDRKISSYINENNLTLDAGYKPTEDLLYDIFVVTFYH